MARPELCVLLAYAKRSLEEAIARIDAAGRPVPRPRACARYFPATVVERFGDAVDRHPLRRDLASTIIANDGRQRPRDHVGLAARARDGRGRRPRSPAPTGSPATSRAPASAGPTWRRSTAKIDPVAPERAHGRRRHARRGRRPLVPAERADARRSARRSRRPAPLFAELAEGDRARSAPRPGGALARPSSRDLVSTGRRRGARPPPRVSSRSSRTRPTSSPSRARPAGRSRTSRTAFFLAGERLHLDWLERQLPELPETLALAALGRPGHGGRPDGAAPRHRAARARARRRAPDRDRGRRTTSQHACRGLRAARQARRPRSGPRAKRASPP